MTPTAPPSLPVQLEKHPAESVESWLERLANVNHLTHPAIMRALKSNPHNARPTERTTHPAASPPSGWMPGRNTQMCTACLTEDAIWRETWHHPMTTLCLRHHCWLHAACPTCQLPFRHHEHHYLRSVDANPGTCGNPTGHRGQPCPQKLDQLTAQRADDATLGSQQRIHDATAGAPQTITGSLVSAQDYLTEVKALTVLLLHLVIQPGGHALAHWAGAASVDRDRSPGGRTARWGLTPPADPVLRGQAIAAADRILTSDSLDAGADLLHAWTELTPDTAEGHLGWLADHTRMTPLLSRLVMAASATRRRVSTLLHHDSPPRLLPVTAIPQAIPTASYRLHLARHLDVGETVGRTYAALCLARRHSAATTWSWAAVLLGFPGDHAVDVARRGSSRLTCRPDTFVVALDALADDLDPQVDYRVREDVVRRLATQTRWYRTWARTHTPGSRATSRAHAVTWLWTHWARGLLGTSPAWAASPDRATRGYYRRYAARLSTDARDELRRTAESYPRTGIR